ncbi:hypothetical protein ACLOJK_001597 [Asimina triloba]
MQGCHVEEQKDTIKLVPINLDNRPAWYKEKVYPDSEDLPNVPSLEHNNQVKGESLDLLKYIDSNFEGPSLLPDDPAKREFADELISYSDSFNATIYKSFQADGVPEEVGSAFDHLETALSKFDDGPFFLGHFSIVNKSKLLDLFMGDFAVISVPSITARGMLWVDIAYAPFIERYQYTFLELKKYDITAGRPNLTKWIEELNKIDAYTQTIQDPQFLLDGFKSRFLVNNLKLGFTDWKQRQKVTALISLDMANLFISIYLQNK